MANFTDDWDEFFRRLVGQDQEGEDPMGVNPRGAASPGEVDINTSTLSRGTHPLNALDLGQRMPIGRIPGKVIPAGGGQPQFQDTMYRPETPAGLQITEEDILARIMQEGTGGGQDPGSTLPNSPNPIMALLGQLGGANLPVTPSNTEGLPTTVGDGYEPDDVLVDAPTSPYPDLPGAPSMPDVNAIRRQAEADTHMERGPRIKENPKGVKGFMLALAKTAAGGLMGYAQSGKDDWRDAAGHIGMGAAQTLGDHLGNRDDMRNFDSVRDQKLQELLAPVMEQYQLDKAKYGQDLERWKLETAVQDKVRDDKQKKEYQTAQVEARNRQIDAQIQKAREDRLGRQVQIDLQVARFARSVRNDAIKAKANAVNARLRQNLHLQNEMEAQLARLEKKGDPKAYAAINERLGKAREEYIQLVGDLEGIGIEVGGETQRTAKYTPEQQAQAREVIADLKKRNPGATEDELRALFKLHMSKQ